MALIVGLPLEMVHKWWRLFLLYMAGVIAGSLASSIADPKVCWCCSSMLSHWPPLSLIPRCVDVALNCCFAGPPGSLTLRSRCVTVAYRCLRWAACWSARRTAESGRYQTLTEHLNVLYCQLAPIFLSALNNSKEEEGVATWWKYCKPEHRSVNLIVLLLALC